MSANTDRGAGKVFSTAAILTGVTVLIGLLAALKSNTPDGVTWMMWSWYIAALICLVLLILALMLLLKKAVPKALLVLLVFLPAVPVVLIGLPVYLVKQAHQAEEQARGAPTDSADSEEPRQAGADAPK